VLAYDKLVLATGSYPFVPPVPGRDRPHCFVYRTIEDLEAMQAAGQARARGVVIGGGLLGLECAKALRDMGLETHVVEFAPRLMAVQVDEGGGRCCATRSKPGRAGAHQLQHQQITDGASRPPPHGVCRRQHLEADMIVFSAGIRPRDELARQCAGHRRARRHRHRRPLPHQ
jgi:nitrite reductase (NADH) large subunit